eukprot:2426544-Amphidinium_carterae.3
MSCAHSSIVRPTPPTRRGAGRLVHCGRKLCFSSSTVSCATQALPTKFPNEPGSISNPRHAFSPGRCANSTVYEPAVPGARQHTNAPATFRRGGSGV